MWVCVGGWFGGGGVYSKLKPLVYDILPSTTAVFSYAIGSRKLSAKEQFFVFRSNSSKFVTNNSNQTKRVISEGTDRVGGQLRGDKECPFSGVTKSGRVRRKVPESDARKLGSV